MPRLSFYDSEEYRLKQSECTKLNQDKGTYAHLRKRVERICAREGCEVSFQIKPSDPKEFCSRSCVAIVTNSKRIHSDEVRKKISESLKGNTNTRGLVRFKSSSAECQNKDCKNLFTFKRYTQRKFCSGTCAMKVIGSQPTSPKASRGKAGIRIDIDPSTYFYSRWEANMARLYTYLKIPWVFEPATFDIGNQTYTPDFYLPDGDTYVEVKNFWGAYSRARDTKFRKKYPSLKLRVVLKEEYEALEQQYAHLIPEWEYKNSPFI